MASTDTAMLSCDSKFLAGRKFQKYIPQEDSFQKGLYMFDIGQNDLAGAFYSKSLDQILASIPTILVEFETGIQVRISSHLANFKFSRPPFLDWVNIMTLPSFSFISRNYMTKEQEIFGYTTRVLLDAWLRILPSLELTPQSSMN